MSNDTTLRRCYGLVLYYYDYYERDNVIAVSHDTEKLEHEYDVTMERRARNRQTTEPLLDNEDAEKAKKNGNAHYTIEEIKYL